MDKGVGKASDRNRIPQNGMVGRGSLKISMTVTVRVMRLVL